MSKRNNGLSAVPGAIPMGGATLIGTASEQREINQLRETVATISKCNEDLQKIVAEIAAERDELKAFLADQTIFDANEGVPMPPGVTDSAAAAYPAIANDMARKEPPPVTGRNPGVAFGTAPVDEIRLGEVVEFLRSRGYVLHQVMTHREPGAFAKIGIEFGQARDPRIPMDDPFAQCGATEASARLTEQLAGDPAFGSLSDAERDEVN